ncbi:hypothetical protein COEREDRAFT_83867, partial [Coemansia reversa NRRL 1564]
MADTTQSTAEVGITTLDGQMEDFGLVDYEPPVADTQLAEPSDSKPADEVENAEDGLIDYQESDYESDHGAEFVDTEEGCYESKADDTNDRRSESGIVATPNVPLEQPNISVAQKEHYFDADDVMVISDEEKDAVRANDQDQFSDAGDAKDYGNYYSEDNQRWNESDIESGGFVPETWVYSEGEWVVYLGPEQRSYTKEFQLGLFALHLYQLMNVLHGDFLLGDDMEVALEFPSLDLVIDQRDPESRQLDLKQLYNCHVAAVEMGKLSLDYANSPYYSSALQGTFCPLPESFSFVIRTRHKISHTLFRIMDTANEHAKQQTQDLSQDSDHPQNTSTVSNSDKQNEEQPVVVDVEDVEVVENGGDADDQDAANGQILEEVDTAELIHEVEDEEEDEDEDEDFVPGDEEKEDHILDPDAVDEEDEGDNDELEEGTSASHVEEETEEVEEEGAKTRVDSQCASPSNKRTKEQQDTDSKTENVVEEEPVSKKAKSDEVDQQQTVV